MQVFPAKTPEFVKSLFPQFVWQIPDAHKTLYLSFDDGPTPNITDWVLNCLDRYQAKATFFCIGNNIKHHPDIFKRLLEKGHSIGNHTFNHLKGWRTSTSSYLNDIQKTQRLIEPHSSTRLFRPPYGKFRISQARQLLKQDHSIVLWDVLSYDWDKKTSQDQCLNNVISFAKGGSIIVMHDSLKAAPNLTYALPRILDYFSKEGYQFKAIPPTYNPEQYQ